MTQNIVLTTHEGPDADGIGSEIALGLALKGMGKSVRIINPDKTARRFAFLDKQSQIEVFTHRLAKVVADADLVVLLDTSELGRTGRLEKVLSKRSAETIAIDHHPPNGRNVSGLVLPEFSSTGEIVLELISRAEVPITGAMAEALYAAVLYDTHEFRFVRNNPSVFYAAARLVEMGADAEAIAKRLFATVPRDRMVLMARVLADATFECDGRLAWAKITPETLEGLQVDREDVSAIVVALSEIEGVDIAVLFKQFDNNKHKVKVSLRSPGNIPINDVAEALGGGGHLFAAGADIEGTIDEAVSRALPALRAKLTIKRGAS